MRENIPEIAPDRRRGRGTGLNPEGRFERLRREDVDDGWAQDEALPPLRTIVSDERPRRMITRNQSPDVPFDRSLNPYRGCEHGCIYCFARPGHSYLGLSPGLDFETRLVARPAAAEVLERDLRRSSYRPAVIALGTATDPYQPIEGRYGITRGCLEVLRDFRHPVGVVTRGTLVERDVDVLAEMAAMGLAQVGITVTTLDAGLARKLEPRAPSPARRLKMIATLAQAGVPVRVNVSPIIPGLSDDGLEAVMAAARDAGAARASWVMLRLPFEVSELWQDWLDAHYPDRKAKVMARLRDMHGGRDYAPDWGHRMRGEGQYAQMIAHRFKLAQRRLGLDVDLPELRTDLFRVPPRAGDQLSLF